MECGIVGYVVAGHRLVCHGVGDRWAAREISGALLERGHIE